MFTQDLLDFLYHSPTPFHACQQLAARLTAAGFQTLQEGDLWSLQPGGRYYLLRNGSSIIAWVQGQGDLAEQGIRMIGAHTDSPCLRVKPNPELNRQGYWQLGVETYGGVLLGPWFDRDLSLAGRVVVRDGEGGLHALLVDWRRPIAIIPSLAIHLDREANNSRSINPQTQLPPILALSDADLTLEKLVLEQVALQYPTLSAESLVDFELSFYDQQPAAVVGVRGEFLSSARLDNLLSCYLGLQSLLASEGEQSRLLVCSDHEEVGSASCCGAQGPFLRDTLLRLLGGDAAQLQQLLHRSLMVSVDNAHGIHPNFADKHDGNHGPQLNGGPVLKINANQRYATDSIGGAIFAECCRQAGVALQRFVVRTDMGCGSTIGPITATELGVRTLDVGVPTFAMHSIRELAGVQDCLSMQTALTTFLNLPQLPLSA